MEVLDKYFQDSLPFNESSKRPPVPGEENELVSNGGHSTTSVKTASSEKSDKSLKSSKSPAATPRRSVLEKTASYKIDAEEDEAPLGYEPEGMEMIKCADDSSTPPYRRWAENFDLLLNDRDGVNLFKNFLTQEHTVQPLDFCYACRGIKLVEESNKDKFFGLAKTIYKKFIKGDQLQLPQNVKRAIATKLQSKQYDPAMFEAAQSFVEESMRTNLYPLFLNSDIYVQYVQNGGESPKSSHSTSGSSSARPMSTALCTLHENSELRHEDLQMDTDDLTFSSINQSTTSASATFLSLNSSNLVATQATRNPGPTRTRPAPNRERCVPSLQPSTFTVPLSACAMRISNAFPPACLCLRVSGLPCMDATSRCCPSTTRTCQCRSETARTRVMPTPTTPCRHTPTAACKIDLCKNKIYSSFYYAVLHTQSLPVSSLLLLLL